MIKVLSRYGIDETLSPDVQLTLLEKEKQKLLRRLNHVLGDPQREKELSFELDQLENAMSQLESNGGKQLSMEDVQLQIRGLTQTQLAFTEEEEEMDEEEAAQIAEVKKILDLQKEVTADHGKTPELCIPGINRIADFFESRGSLRLMEKWLVRGAQWIPDERFLSRLYRLYREHPNQGGAGDRALDNLFYWARRAAEAGDRDACCDVGRFYTKKPWLNLKKSAYYYAKAAGREHPEAYLNAFQAFYHIPDYPRAEACLLAADKIGVPGASYRMGILYELDENMDGRANPDKARFWLEKAYREHPDGDVCYTLGCRYIEEDRYDDAIRILREGVSAYRSKECEELLTEGF